MIESTRYTLLDPPESRARSILLVPVPPRGLKDGDAYERHISINLSKSAAWYDDQDGDEVVVPGQCYLFRKQDGWQGVIFAACLTDKGADAGHSQACFRSLKSLLSVAGFENHPELYVVLPPFGRGADVFLRVLNSAMAAAPHYVGTFRVPKFPDVNLLAGRIDDSVASIGAIGGGDIPSPSGRARNKP